MHLTNTLISPATAVVTSVVAAALVVVAIMKTRQQATRQTLPMMGAVAIFLLAAQMINFSAPGLAVSGHLVGAVLAAALLGPWSGFLTVAFVIVFQAIVLHDGGVWAMGCNVLNMGGIGCLVTYPLLFRPLASSMKNRTAGVVVASVITSVVAVVGGSAMAVMENALSGGGVALPMAEFMSLMTIRHLAIGAAEGVITAAVLYLVWVRQPLAMETFAFRHQPTLESIARQRRRVTIALALSAVVLMAIALSPLPSSKPDGLEQTAMELRVEN